MGVFSFEFWNGSALRTLQVLLVDVTEGRVFYLKNREERLYLTKNI